MGRLKCFLCKVWSVIRLLGPPEGDMVFTSKEFRQRQRYKKLQEENERLRAIIEEYEDVRDPQVTNEDGTQKNSFKDGF